MCTVLPIVGLSEGTILVSSHKTMSTVAILVRNTIVKTKKTFFFAVLNIFIDLCSHSLGKYIQEAMKPQISLPASHLYFNTSYNTVSNCASRQHTHTHKNISSLFVNVADTTISSVMVGYEWLILFSNTISVRKCSCVRHDKESGTWNNRWMRTWVSDKGLGHRTLSTWYLFLLSFTATRRFPLFCCSLD